METKHLKKYAPEARRNIIAAVKNKAAVYGLLPKEILPMREEGDVVIIGDRPFPRSVAKQRQELESRIDKEGFQHVIEAIAYTWFNRFVAIRFMELHGYLDHGYRVLSHPAGKSTPEILEHAERIKLPGLDRDKVIDLKLDGRQDELLYRMLLLAQCAELNRILPSIFGRLDDATALLLPDNLLHSDSLVRQLVAGSEEANWQQVEVLGWIYQFYIAEQKDTVMARKSAVPTDDIPAVTQLFTPHWIVCYLVENSLGRLWLLNRPDSRLREHMPYYIEGEAETDFLKITNPEEIRLCDPAVGSGHMLTYAFDLLSLIYEEEGYASAEIPALILRHNLHGLEICPRAAQLAELALVFKAREKSRRFFQPENLVRPRIIELRDVCFAENELRDYIHALGLGDLFNQPMLRLLHQFEEAKNFGSLIQPCLDERAIANARRAIEDRWSPSSNPSPLAPNPFPSLFLRETHLKVLRVLEQAEALTQRYHVVVANPPYMGSNGMNGDLAAFTKKDYAQSKADLMTCFMERACSLCVENGFWGMVNIPTWMFLSSFEDLRRALLSTQRILSLVHLGRGLFGADFGAVAFSIQNAVLNGDHFGTYRRLFEKQVDVRTPEKIRDLFLDGTYGRHRANQTTFLNIPGAPIAYWISPKLQEVFISAPKMSSIVDAKQGLSTSDNPRFLRQWWEVNDDLRGRHGNDRSDFSDGRLRWALYNKGGSFRRWYGNQEHVIWWRDNGRDIESLKPKSVLRGANYYFSRSVSWLSYTVSRNSFRAYPEGFIFDTSAHSAFSNEEHVLDHVICFGNSNAFEVIATVINPTVNFHSGNFLDCPRVDVDETKIKHLAKALIEISRCDWDNFETSWDFRDQPLLRPALKGATLEASWRNWEAQSTAAIRRMQELETENNRLFIAAYGLDGELQPEVPEAQITLARAEVRTDMAAFLSYAVGCMMGRYSLARPGLVLADAGGTIDDYWRIVGKDEVRSMNDEGNPAAPADPNFIPDADGIIPVLDSEWFEDDIVARTKEFLRATFGESTLGENIGFIEKSLGKELRAYFLSEFYKDHLQTYKNRPIYWLFSSGKEKAFQCLVYLHRYTPATLARIRTEYVIPLQGKLAARIGHIEEEKTHATATSQRKKLQTEQDKLRKQQAELLKYDEQLRHHSDLKIALDLDDGVKVNYAKLGPLVAEAKKIYGTKED